MHSPRFAFNHILLVLLVSCTWWSAAAQTGAPTVTRLLVTTHHVKPERIEQWLALQQNEVVPALKESGLREYTVYQTVLGHASEFVTVRPLSTFAEFDAPDPLEAVLGAQRAAALLAKLRDCTSAIERRIEDRRDEFFLDPGRAQALYASRYRAAPGRGQDYMTFVRNEMIPVMRQAKEAGFFSGLSVTVSAHGGESGLITLNMYYPDLASLDEPPPVAKTLGPEGTREFIAKGAGLIIPLEWVVRRRLAALSF